MRGVRPGAAIFRESSFIGASLQGLCKLRRWHNSAPPRRQLVAVRIKVGRSHANVSRRLLRFEGRRAVTRANQDIDTRLPL